MYLNSTDQLRRSLPVDFAEGSVVPPPGLFPAPACNRPPKQSMSAMGTSQRCVALIKQTMCIHPWMFFFFC